MKERPIIFSAPMVRALLAGTKAQTRRILKPQPWRDVVAVRDVAPAGDAMNSGSWCSWTAGGDISAHVKFWWRCPYGAPGDRLWVKETWAVETEHGVGDPYRWVHYRSTPHHGIRVWPSVADVTYLHESATPERVAEHVAGIHWKSSRFMPRWASRITLEITDVRVQRLQEISEEDARAEGVTDSWPEIECNGARPYAQGFAYLWDEINGKRAPWKSNQWVFALTFRKLP